MQARYELQRFSIGGIRLLLALTALLLLAALGGYSLRAATFGQPVPVRAASVPSRTVLSYDDWVHDQAAQSAVTVPEDSRATAAQPVQVHEGR